MSEKIKLNRKEKLTILLEEIEELIQSVLAWEEKYKEKIEQVHPEYLESARNLVHYWALRSKNLNSLQRRLGNFGLSRLSEAESHIMASLQTTRSILKSMMNEKCKFPRSQLSFKKSRRLIRRNAKDLLGYRSKGRRTRIMVTLPDKAAEDFQLVHDMIRNGMNCARINCAHETPEEWRKMIENVHKASEQLRKNCKISMDLSGPKIRTGMIAEDAKVVKIQYETDAFGNDIKPIKVYFGEGNNNSEIPEIPLADFNPSFLKEGDILNFTDSRFKEREIEVCHIYKNGFLGNLNKITFFETGLPLKLAEQNLFSIGELEEKKKPIFLQENDVLIIKKDQKEGHRKIITETGEIEPAYITCTSNEIFSMVKAGEPILFDDGIIEGIVQDITPNEIRILITAVPDKGGKLRPDKGINFPQSKLQLPSLSDQDREILPFVLKNTNVINLSFVNRPEDVGELLKILQENQIEHELGLILKIETSAGFENLPEILLEAMKIYPIGVMIARGDLAVEIGWEKIGRIQEEILSVCKAAHVTSIWATQVLENLAKKGIPSRAEITDTVMAQRADCIMLNKGSYILKAIKLLDTILKNLGKDSTALRPVEE
ncbi:MAG: pyruvate kinase [Candidatus Cloacimonadales bacterium]|nr:pyruvate kinase [Candidatus Cloacimonadales bacterium]